MLRIDDAAVDFATIAELAAAEKIDSSYLSRVLRLNNLAPDIIEAIVEGRQIGGATLAMLLETFPAEWGRQRQLFALNGHCCRTQAFGVTSPLPCDVRSRERSLPCRGH